MKTRVLNFFRSFFKWAPATSLLRKCTNGKSPKSFFGRMVPPNYLFARGTQRSCINHGITLSGDLNDFVFHGIYFGFKDVAAENFFSRIKKGQMVIDIGANLGYFALRAAEKTGKTGCVWAFEANPHNYVALEHNSCENPNFPVTAFNLALGKSTGWITTEVNATNRGGAFINSQTQLQQANSVAMKLLDDVIEEQKNAKPINWIKIDTEGFEYNILVGSSKTIEKYKPGLFIEINDTHLRRFGSDFKMVYSFLHHHNYKAVDASTGAPVDLLTEQTPQHFDLLAINGNG